MLQDVPAALQLSQQHSEQPNSQQCSQQALSQQAASQPVASQEVTTEDVTPQESQEDKENIDQGEQLQPIVCTMSCGGSILTKVIVMHGIELCHSYDILTECNIDQ